MLYEQTSTGDKGDERPGSRQALRQLLAKQYDIRLQTPRSTVNTEIRIRIDHVKSRFSRRCQQPDSDKAYCLSLS